MKGSRAVIVISVVLLLMLVLIVPASMARSDATHGTTYYVAPTGDDAQPGTLDRPWRTIQKAANTVEAGSTVYVRGGVYAEKVIMNVSGAPGRVITFQSYPGETAIIDGSDLTPPDGWSALIDIRDKSHLVIKGFELRNYQTAKKNHMPMGIFVTGAGDDIQILDNKVHHIETNFNGRNGGDAHGIAVYGTRAPQALTNIVIDGNEAYALKLGSSESVVVNGNVDGFRITDNVVHDNNNIGIDAIGFEGKAPDPAYDQARHGLIARNTVYNIDSYKNPAYGNDRSADGIYIDGGTRIVVERNITHDCNIGIELASEHAGRSTSFITLRNNFIYHNTSMGIAIGGYDTERGSTESCVIVNNTLFHNDYRKEGNGELLVQFDTRNNVIKNNIFYANNVNALIVNPYVENTGNVVDYNLYFAPGGAADSTWQWQNVTYTGFDNYQAQTGNDAHGLFVNPKLVSTSMFDLHLRTNSPAIDRGQAIAEAGDKDIDGQPRVRGGAIDIGADEAR
jgi:Right handed beta helix region/Pel9A-like, right handed beta helix region